MGRSCGTGILPVFRRILELDPDVHVARTIVSWIELFEMIHCAKVVMNQHWRDSQL
jgi:hypothetical protein